jgi:hypothetical protein
MNFPGARHLSDVDGDEVSLVKRAANRRRFLLTKSAEGIDPELADFLAVPAPGEGALLDEVRKDGGDETTEMAVVAAVRLLKGVGEDLSDSTREQIAKLGSEMYTDPGAAGAPLNMAAGQSEDLDGTFANDENWNDDDMDDVAVGKDGGKPYGNVTYADPGYQKDGKSRYPIDTEEHVRAAWSYINQKKNAAKYSPGNLSKIKAKIAAAMKRHGADVSKSTIEPSEGGDPVETHAVPIQKEDGTWDLSGVPAEGRPFFEAMIQKAASAETELEKTREALTKSDERTTQLADALKTREFIAKAETELPAVGPADKVALILKAASESMDEETYQELETILKANNEKIATGDLFAELGRTGLGEAQKPGSALSEAIAKADEMVAKGDGLNRDVALGKVWEDNPALYDRYIAEKPTLRSYGQAPSPASFAAFQGGEQ